MKAIPPQLKSLYEDALYFHYIGEGYPDSKARIMARRMVANVSNN